MKNPTPLQFFDLILGVLSLIQLFEDIQDFASFGYWPMPSTVLSSLGVGLSIIAYLALEKGKSR